MSKPATELAHLFRVLKGDSYRLRDRDLARPTTDDCTLGHRGSGLAGSHTHPKGGKSQAAKGGQFSCG